MASHNVEFLTGCLRQRLTVSTMHVSEVSVPLSCPVPTPCSRPTAVNLSDAADKLLLLSQKAAAADGATADSVVSVRETDPGLSVQWHEVN